MSCSTIYPDKPRKGEAYVLEFTLEDENEDPLTGAASLAATIRKDGGASASATNAPTEIGTASGFYRLLLTEEERDAERNQILITATGARPCRIILLSATDQIDTMQHVLGRVDQSVIQLVQDMLGAKAEILNARDAARSADDKGTTTLTDTAILKTNTATIQSGVDAANTALSALGTAVAAVQTDVGEIQADLGNGVPVAEGGITTASFAAGAITASAIAPDALGSSELGGSAAQEIANAVGGGGGGGGGGTLRVCLNLEGPLPERRAVLTEGDTGVDLDYVCRDLFERPIPLPSGAVVAFTLRARGASSAVVNAEPAEVREGVPGGLRFAFSEAIPVPAAGDYDAVFSVDGVSFPAGRYLPVSVLSRLSEE